MMLKLEFAVLFQDSTSPVQFFFTEIVNAEHYGNNFEEFVEQLDDVEYHKGYFARYFYEKDAISFRSQGDFQRTLAFKITRFYARSFFLVRLFKTEVRMNNPHTLGELKENIRLQISTTLEEMLQQVAAHMCCHAHPCKQENEMHFEHLL